MEAEGENLLRAIVKWSFRNIQIYRTSEASNKK